jgi:hypothetical protein
LAGAFLCAATTTRAQLTVTHTVAYQVIQRDTGTKVATWTDSGDCRTGTTKIQLQVVSQKDGSAVGDFAWKDLSDVAVTGTRWKGTVAGLPVGGEYRARFRALGSTGLPTDSSASIEHVLVGDVWFCAGQSNMQQDPGVQLDTAHVHTRVLWSSQPADTEGARWGKTRTTGPTTSFGNRLYAKTGVPVGIVFAAKGGTSIDDWFYVDTLTPLFVSASRFLDKGVAGWKIGGFLWYQGENEDQQDTWASRYMVKFSRLRDTVRKLSNNAHLPVIAVQLESWDGTSQFPLNPYSRWVRWPITRDQQERIGRADPWSATAPIWPAAGLHINGANQALLGTYAAAIATRKFHPSVTDSGAGPLFQSAWFLDTTRKDVVVKFSNVTGRLSNPADPNHLGFYVMKHGVFDIDDSTIFDYGTDSYGNPAKMLLAINSMDTLGTDRVVLHLAARAPDSASVGYGRHIQLVSLSPLTDASKIPVPTFFDRAIAASFATAGVEARPATPRVEVVGSIVVFPGEASLEVRRPDGTLLLRRNLSGSFDLRSAGLRGPLLLEVRGSAGARSMSVFVD